MRGDISPADHFTKHLPSKGQIHQPTALLGCEYRSVRAAAPPFSRPHDDDRREGGYPSVGEALPAFVNDELEAHDTGWLPHMHDDLEIKKFFPLIKAAPPLINDEDGQPEVEGPQDEVKYVDGLPTVRFRRVAGPSWPASLLAKGTGEPPMTAW